MISEELQNDALSDEIAVSNEKQDDNEGESKKDQNESPVDEIGCGCWSITKQCIKYCCMVVLYILLPLVPAILSFLILIICALATPLWIILSFAKFFSFCFYKVCKFKHFLDVPSIDLFICLFPIGLVVLCVIFIPAWIIFIVAWILLPFVVPFSYCFCHEMYKDYLRKGMKASNYVKSVLSKIQWDLVRFLFNQVIMTAVDIGTDVYQAYEYYSRYNYKYA